MAGKLKAGFILEVIDRATAPMKRVTRDFAAMARARERADAAFQRAANMRQAAEGISRFATAARAAIAAPVSEFAGFEKAMSRVKAVTGNLTEEGFGQLSDKAKELGATTQWTATQAAEALGFFGMAGWNASQQLGAIAPALDLASAAGTDLARTADIMSDIMGAFQLDSSEAAKTADIMTRSFTSANMTLEDMYEGMKYVGPIAKQYNASLAETSALMGLLANVGIKGSSAGTALRVAYAKLTDPVGKAAGTLKELGVQTKDSAGDLRAVPDIIADVFEAMEGMGTAEKGARLSRLFGLRGITPTAALGGMGRQAVEEMFAQVKDGSKTAASVAGTMMDNLSGDLTKLDSAMSGLKTTVGEALAPAIRDLATAVTEVLSSATAWAKENPRLTKTLGMVALAVAGVATGLTGLVFTMAGVTTALGVASYAFGLNRTGAQLMGAAIKFLLTPVKAFAVAVWSKLIPPLVAWAKAQWAVVAPIAATLAPILAVTAAVGALVLAVKQLVEYWDRLDFGEAFQGITETLAEKGIWETWSQLVDVEPLLQDVGLIGGGEAPSVPLVEGGATTARSESKVEIGLADGLQLRSAQTKGPTALDVSTNTGPLLAPGMP